jgi:uncharacterized membrane protein YgdD (TMEM256/DUF423 family)
MNKQSLMLAASIAAIGVVLGAFGAHGLKKIVPDMDLINSWETGVRYQIYHAFAIALVAVTQSQFKSPVMYTSIRLFVAGILLFSGSIYALVLLKSLMSIKLGALAMLTPLGGVVLIIAWILYIMGLKKS